MPLQLPTSSELPARALMRLVLPVLGVPTMNQRPGAVPWGAAPPALASAQLDWRLQNRQDTLVPFHSCGSDEDVGRFAGTHHQVNRTCPEMEGTLAWASTEDFAEVLGRTPRASSGERCGVRRRAERRGRDVRTRSRRGRRVRSRGRWFAAWRGYWSRRLGFHEASVAVRAPRGVGTNIPEYSTMK